MERQRNEKTKKVNKNDYMAMREESNGNMSGEKLVR